MRSEDVPVSVLQVTLFIAFICFCVAFKPKYIVATGLEFLISFFLLLLYGLKLNQMLTFFMWPLVVSDTAALYSFIIKGPFF